MVTTLEVALNRQLTSIYTCTFPKPNKPNRICLNKSVSMFGKVVTSLIEGLNEIFSAQLGCPKYEYLTKFRS